LDLSPNHEPLDYWRKYAIGGGRLYYDELSQQPEIVHATDVISHVVKTPYTSDKLPGIPRACIHVLPVNWVRSGLLLMIIKLTHRSMIHFYCITDKAHAPDLQEGSGRGQSTRNCDSELE
jgi:hypothetical protein